MVGRLDRNGVLRGDRAELDQELGDVADLGDECLGRLGVAGREEVGVVLEHRPAAGGVDDDGVEAVGVEGGDVPAGEVQRRALDARMVVDRPAAALPRRDDDLAAVGLEDPGGRGVGLGEHGVGHAPQEERDPGPPRADRREDGREPRSRARQRREHRLQPPEGWREELGQANPVGEVDRPEPLEQPGRRQGQLDPAGEGEQVVEDQPLEDPGPVAGRCRGVEGDLEGLDDLAVLDPRRAGGLAGPAVEAEVEVLPDLGRGANPPISDRPHQVDPAPGAVVLVGRLDIRRAARGAEPAVDAVLIQAIGNLRGQPGQVDARPAGARRRFVRDRHEGSNLGGRWMKARVGPRRSARDSALLEPGVSCRVASSGARPTGPAWWASLRSTPPYENKSGRGPA